jgi:hypothetical protein
MANTSAQVQGYGSPVASAFSLDPFYLHSNKPLAKFIHFLFNAERQY